MTRKNKKEEVYEKNYNFHDEKDGDLPHITPHSFRHMTATFLITASVDLTTAAGKLGQENSTTTQIIYSHLLDKSEKETANTMEAILSQSMIAACKFD